MSFIFGFFNERKLREEVMSMLDNLAAQVAANTTVIESAVVLLGGLKVQLDAAIASGDPVRMQALSDALAADDAKLAAAIAANQTPTP